LSDYSRLLCRWSTTKPGSSFGSIRSTEIRGSQSSPSTSRSRRSRTSSLERAFVKEYGVKYTYLIAGAPSEMWEKVPQAVNLNTWPATIFVGRDGLVKGIHSGFSSQASGEFNTQLQEEFTAKIEQLLAQKAGENLAAATAQVKPGQ
jgi:hypothetical protein